MGEDEKSVAMSGVCHCSYTTRPNKKARMLARKKEEIDSINHGIDRKTEKKEMPIVWMFLNFYSAMKP